MIFNDFDEMARDVRRTLERKNIYCYSAITVLGRRASQRHLGILDGKVEVPTRFTTTHIPRICLRGTTT